MGTVKFSRNAFRFGILFVFALSISAFGYAYAQSDERPAPPAMDGSKTPPPDLGAPPEDSMNRIDRMVNRMDEKLALSDEQKDRIKKILENAQAEARKERESNGAGPQNRDQMKPPGGGAPDGMQGGGPGGGRGGMMPGGGPGGGRGGMMPGDGPGGRPDRNTKSLERMNTTFKAIEMVLDSDQQKKFKKMREEFRRSLLERRSVNRGQPPPPSDEDMSMPEK